MVSTFLAHNHSGLVLMVCRYREINPEVDVSTSRITEVQGLVQNPWLRGRTSSSLNGTPVAKP